jgi:hypothetical protein
MNWIEGLLDHLATKLALKVRAQLDGAIDAALDRAEDRIDTAFEGLEERLHAAATKRIADLKVTLGPVLQLQQQIEPLEAAVKPALALQQQIEAISPERLQAAAEAAGMIPAKEMKAQNAFAASSASDAARDHLRSRLTPPRPWKEIPDR